MATLTTILIVIAVLIAFLVLFKVLKSIVKAAISILFLLFVLIAILGVVAYMDAGRLAEAFSEGQAVYLLKDGTIRSGVFIERPDLSLDTLTGNTVNIMGGEEVSSANEAYTDKEYSVMMGNKSLLVIAKYKSFNGNETITLKDVEVELGSDKIERILDTESFEEAISIIFEGEGYSEARLEMAKNNIRADFNEDIYELKGAILVSLFADALKDRGLSYLAENARKGYVVVKPNFISLRMIGFMPEMLTQRLFR